MDPTDTTAALEQEPIPSFRRGCWRGETWIFHQSTPRARKRHDAECCGQSIEPGTRYVKFVTRNVEGPGFETWRVHGECYLTSQPMFYGQRPPWRWQGPDGT